MFRYTRFLLLVLILGLSAFSLSAQKVPTDDAVPPSAPDSPKAPAQNEAVPAEGTKPADETPAEEESTGENPSDPESVAPAPSSPAPERPAPATPPSSSPESLDNPEDLLATAPDGSPQWVTLVRQGRYGDLVPPAGGYVGIGTGMTEGEAVASASVDFAANVSMTVTSTVSERRSGSDSTEDGEYEIASEIRSQAVLSGIRPWVYQLSDTEWYALYRIEAAEYQEKVQSWMENVALMGEAARQEELERLRQQQFDMEAAAEAERAAQREAELEAQRREEARQMLARREESFLQSGLNSRILTVETASVPARHFWLFTDGRLGEEGLFDLRIGTGFQIFRIISIGMETGGYRTDYEDFSVPELAATAKIQLINNAGLASTLSLAAGGRIIFDPRTWDEESPEIRKAYYVAGHIHIPRPLHGSYFLYAGNDRVALGAQWAPFWRSMENTIVLETAVDADFGYRTYESGSYTDLRVMAGVGFRPVQALRIHVFTASLTVTGVTVSTGL